MFKCLESITFARLRWAVWAFTALGLGAELYLIVISGQVLAVYPQNQLFIGLFLMCLFSILFLGFSAVLAHILQRVFTVRVKICCAITILAFLALAGSQLYFAIFVSSLQNYLSSELELCESSSVFSELYWAFAKVGYLCKDSFNSCPCLYDSTCTTPLVAVLFTHFQCTSLCGTENTDCSAALNKVIRTVCMTLSALSAICFIIMFTLSIAILGLIKKRKEENSVCEIKERNLRSFNGIVEQSEVRNGENEERKIEDLSEIPRVEELESDHRSIQLVFNESL
jgi:hypothetical protein